MQKWKVLSLRGDGIIIIIISINVSSIMTVPRNVCRILVGGQCPLPPEVKKILKI